MSKFQCFIASTLCIAFGLIFTYPLAQFAPPLVAVVYGSVLVGLGGVFYTIGANKIKQLLDKGDIKMNKYIIKNCPNITYCPSHKEYECGLCLEGENYKRKCSDNTNCVLKQIVELCKSACIDCSSIKRVTYIQCKDLNNCKTARILTFLDIQEVE